METNQNLTLSSIPVIDKHSTCNIFFSVSLILFKIKFDVVFDPFSFNPPLPTLPNPHSHVRCRMQQLDFGQCSVTMVDEDDDITAEP